MSFIGFARRCGALITLFPTLFWLAGCGGGSSGSSDTLTVSVRINGSAELMKPTVIQPTLIGFNGHAPNCSLTSGRLPEGMTLRSDCAIAGTPMEVGSFSFGVRVGAAGVSNSLDWQGGVSVYGPSVLYQFDSGWVLGQVVDHPPLNSIFWTPWAGATVTYSVRSGALPAGLSVHPTTGRVIGTVSSIGSQRFRIGASVTSGGRTVTIEQTADNETYSWLGVGLYPQEATATLGSDFALTPVLPNQPAATYQFSIENLTTPGRALPQGLALNPATGSITGVASRVGEREHYSVRLQLSYNGFQSEAAFPIWIEGRSPVTVFYGQWFGITNNPTRWSPTRYGTLTGGTYAFSVNPATPLPAGYVVDAATGDIVGSSPNPVNARYLIDVRVTTSENNVFFLTVPIDIELRSL